MGAGVGRIIGGRVDSCVGIRIGSVDCEGVVL